MKSSVSKTIKVASVYIGTVLGAGFASGQELLKFFAAYGKGGMFGLLLTGVMFAIIGWAVLEMVYIYKIKSYREFIYPMMGEFLGSIMELVVSLFMLTCFCVMLAGSGALLRQRFGIPNQIGILIMAAACYVTFLYDVKGVVVINTILAPILLIGGFLLGINILLFREAEVFGSSVVHAFKVITDNWVASSIIYVSYNTITAVVVLTSLFNLIESKKCARVGAIMAGSVLGLLGLCLGIATLINYGKIIGVEIPLLAIVMQYTPLMQYTYICVLIAAMFTTAVANGYGFVSRMSSVLHVNQRRFTLVFILIAIIIAQLGFSNMVSRIYPLFGYIGIFEVVLILLYFIFIKVKRLRSKYLSRYKKRLEFFQRKFITKDE